jgi:hypothetical protein
MSMMPNHVLNGSLDVFQRQAKRLQRPVIATIFLRRSTFSCVAEFKTLTSGSYEPIRPTEEITKHDPTDYSYRSRPPAVKEAHIHLRHIS